MTGRVPTTAMPVPLRGLVHEGRPRSPERRIAAQAGWSEKSVDKMVETYAHAVDDRRLDEIDAAFAIRDQRDANHDAQRA